MATTENQKPSMADYLEMDGSMIFNIALFNRFSSFGDSCYREICGGFIEGAMQWAQHNVYGVNECANAKYTGWTINFENGSSQKVYIENWVMNADIKDWKHAKNLFNKYLKVKA